MSVKDKVVGYLKSNIIDATALMVESNPFFAVYEVAVADMSDWTSLKSRFWGTVAAYVGLGKLYVGGKNKSQEIVGINEHSSKWVQRIHDSVYTMGFAGIVSPILYFALSGERDPEKIVIATVGSMGLGLINGPFLGWTTDAVGDLSSSKECKRKDYPDFIRIQKQKTKRGILAGAVAVSIGLTAIVYPLVPNGILSPKRIFGNAEVENVEQSGLEEKLDF